MKVLTLGQPLSSDPAEVMRWLQTSMRTIQDASNEDTESTVVDGFSVSNPPDPVRTLDAAGTASNVIDNSGGVPSGTTLALVTLPTFNWNGALSPTAAQAAAINAAFTALMNNLSTVVSANATLMADNANLRAFVATYIEDSRYRGQNRED